MERVNKIDRNHFVVRYNKARGGAGNEATASEAMFVAAEMFTGIYIYNEHLGMWVGVSNATSRISYYGKPAPSTDEAVDRALGIGFEVYYSEDPVTRLRWMADTIEKWKGLDRYRLTPAR